MKMKMWLKGRVMATIRKIPFKCPVCEGTGQDPKADPKADKGVPCPACKGTCVVWGEETVSNEPKAQPGPEKSDINRPDAMGKFLDEGYEPLKDAPFKLTEDDIKQLRKNWEDAQKTQPVDPTPPGYWPTWWPYVPYPNPYVPSPCPPPYIGDPPTWPNGNIFYTITNASWKPNFGF
jgi:hypothetical protein